VLYDCCVSRGQAAEIITHDFESGQSVHVLDQPPSHKRDAKRPCAIVFLGTRLHDPRLRGGEDEDGEQGWLIARSVLNGFPRCGRGDRTWTSQNRRRRRGASIHANAGFLDLEIRTLHILLAR
jgi:hypothetical protein